MCRQPQGWQISTWTINSSRFNKNRFGGHEGSFEGFGIEWNLIGLGGNFAYFGLHFAPVPQSTLSGTPEELQLLGGQLPGARGLRLQSGTEGRPLLLVLEATGLKATKQMVTVFNPKQLYFSLQSFCGGKSWNF